MTFQLRIAREDDGRWIGEYPHPPGVFVYGATRAEAQRRATVLLLDVLAEQIEYGERGLNNITIIPSPTND